LLLLTVSIADLPECINSCFDPTFLAAVITSCPKLTADMPCLCNNKQFIDSVLTCIYV
jgi:hypothetical protein